MFKTGPLAFDTKVQDLPKFETGPTGVMFIQNLSITKYLVNLAITSETTYCHPEDHPVGPNAFVRLPPLTSSLDIHFNILSHSPHGLLSLT
jgi:hypothetical protein